MFINPFFSPLCLVYIALLLLERGPALECDQPTSCHIIKENRVSYRVSLFPQLSDPNISSASSGIPCTSPLPHTGIPFRSSLGSSLACGHNRCEFEMSAVPCCVWETLFLWYHPPSFFLQPLWVALLTASFLLTSFLLKPPWVVLWSSNMPLN